VTSVFDFDINDRLAQIRHAKYAAGLFEVSYGYDAAGGRRYTRDMLATDHSELYTHDDRDRLRGFKRGVLNEAGTDIETPLNDPVLPSAQRWDQGAGLDKRGNWLDSSLTVNGVTTPQTRTVNAVNEYLTIDPDGPGGPQPPVSLAHDDNGNLTHDPTARNAGDDPAPAGQKYEYDEENRLTRIKRASDNEVLLEIGYDALWRRVESREYLDAATGDILDPPRVTRHVFVGAETIEDYAVTNGGQTIALAREFVWGKTFPEPVALIDHTDAGDLPPEQAEVLHYLHDVLGSVVALTKASGEGTAVVVERYRYDAYGTTYVYAADGTTLRTVSRYANPFAFTGQRYDTAVGTYHFLYRTYLPWLGRWGQRDPLGYVDGVSLYEYVASAPLEGLDALGAESASGPPSSWPPRPRGCDPSWPWVPNRNPNPGPKEDPGHIRDPKTGDKWRYHPEDDEHNPHWDRVPRHGPEEQIPIGDKPIFKPPPPPPPPPPPVRPPKPPWWVPLGPGQLLPPIPLWFRNLLPPSLFPPSLNPGNPGYIIASPGGHGWPGPGAAASSLEASASE
jgi:RHS repeat-associated protein